MTKLSRRSLLMASVASLSLGAFSLPVLAQDIDELVIAYNVNLPSWDPTVGLSAVNPTIQGLYQSVFDMFIYQNPDLSFGPGLITAWGWNDDSTQIYMDVREGVTWHDGSPFTPEDVVWSLERAGDPEGGNPIQFIWGKIGNFSIDGNRITADVKEYEPTIFKWMAFLTGYVMPKAYYEKVGADGFEAAPIGTGPFVVTGFRPNDVISLAANENYRDASKPAFATVTSKAAAAQLTPVAWCWKPANSTMLGTCNWHLMCLKRWKLPARAMSCLHSARLSNASWSTRPTPIQPWVTSAAQSSTRTRS